MKQPVRATLHRTHGWFDYLFRYLDRRSPFDRTLLSVLLLCIVCSGIVWLWHTSQSAQTVVPNQGGTLHEGIVGSPRFVNPVLATTRADRDLAALLFRGLLTLDATGTLVPDLAESVSVSDDGLVYNVRLRSEQTWHDGSPITAADVVFTIGLVQNPELRSPLRGNWNGVTVETVDTHELNLILDEPYAPFRENLTLGIVPKHLWERFSPDEFPFSQYNTEPVGSGPYKLDTTVRTETGLIAEYHLTRVPTYEPKPAIAAVHVHFFSDEATLRDAIREGAITHTAGLNPNSIAALADSLTVYQQPLPRVFALYPNQNRNPALRDQAARTALNYAIDREALIEKVLAGFGEPITTPLPAGFGTPTSAHATSGVEKAEAALIAGGWEQGEAGGWEKEIDGEMVPLTLTIATANTKLFEDTATVVRDAWEALGVEVGVAFYEQADLVQAVIRPRDYELLLFGTDIGRALDLYPFWHSSQREDPGLNVAQYTNLTTDDILESYRTATSSAERDAQLQTFVAEVREEQPAIFLFSPLFTYVTTSDTPINLSARLGHPSERFATLTSWHIESESLWPIFVD